MAGLLSIFAEFERDLLSERIKTGIPSDLPIDLLTKL